MADEFIDSVANFSCRIAKHRGSDTLETKDLQLHLGLYPHLLTFEYHSYVAVFQNVIITFEYLGSLQTRRVFPYHRVHFYLRTQPLARLARSQDRGHI